MLNTLYIIWLIYQTSSLGQSEAALTDIRHLNHVPPIIYNTLFIVCVWIKIVLSSWTSYFGMVILKIIFTFLNDHSKIEISIPKLFQKSYFKKIKIIIFWNDHFKIGWYKIILKWSFWNCCSTTNVPPHTRNPTCKGRRRKVVVWHHEEGVGVARWRTRLLSSWEGEGGGVMWNTRSHVKEELLRREYTYEVSVVAGIRATVVWERCHKKF